MSGGVSQLPPATALQTAAAFPPRRRLLAVAVVAIAFVMDLVDTTIVNVAVPAIRQSLGAGPAAAQWLVAGYSMAFAVLLITGGRLGDLYGYRRIFLGGVAGFTVASSLCGLAMGPETLVAARVLQGLAAALMVPQVLALTQILYPADQRVAVMALFGVLGGLSAVLGPILGGFLIDADLFGLSWRPVFLLNLPVGVLGLAMGLAVLPGGRSSHAGRPDWPGTVLLAAALSALLLPLIQGREAGWPAWCLALLGLTLPLTGLFAWHVRWRIRRVGSALLVPALFRDRAFSVGLATLIVFQLAMGGFFLVTTLSLQEGLGFTPTQAALIHVPFALGVSVGISVLGRRLILRAGRYTVTAGCLVMAASLPALRGALGIVHGGTVQGGIIDGGLLPLLAAFLAAGVGMGLVAAALTPFTLSATDARHAGAAAGVVNATQQLGAALGVALIGALFFRLAGQHTGTAYVHAFGASAILMDTALLAAGVFSLGLPRDLRTGAGIAHV
ncbi:MFS transporter [Nitrospirillum sp. BR 11164]|uniref:MFS transporter n=1 Tax=Nitrospirillum sp. BR 11164 TaxID=3104324 RepID=UPI002AFE5D2C|nr:MFS transporter [Nitrospirillum sp. BR 11164]MEA1652797.1 MFS transporter [Nitrospirillum sp. BR 11164]